MNTLKSRHSIIFKAIIMGVVCLFLFNDIAFALAPKLATTSGKEFRDKWLSADISFLIGDTLVIARAQNIQNPKDILIPRIKQHLRDKDVAEGTLAAGYDIDSVYETRNQSGELISFTVPVLRGGKHVYKLEYYLNRNDIKDESDRRHCETLPVSKDGANVYVVTRAASPAPARAEESSTFVQQINKSVEQCFKVIRFFSEVGSQDSKEYYPHPYNDNEKSTAFLSWDMGKSFKCAPLVSYSQREILRGGHRGEEWGETNTYVDHKEAWEILAAENKQSAALRGVVQLFADRPEGIVRIDPPENIDSFLRHKLGVNDLQPEDSKMYEILLLHEIIETIKFFVSQGLNPGKKLIILDSLKEVFSRHGCYMPSQPTINDFLLMTRSIAPNSVSPIAQVSFNSVQNTAPSSIRGTTRATDADWPAKPDVENLDLIDAVSAYLQYIKSVQEIIGKIDDSSVYMRPETEPDGTPHKIPFKQIKHDTYNTMSATAILLPQLEDKVPGAMQFLRNLCYRLEDDVGVLDAISGSSLSKDITAKGTPKDPVSDLNEAFLLLAKKAFVYSPDHAEKLSKFNEGRLILAEAIKDLKKIAGCVDSMRWPQAYKQSPYGKLERACKYESLGLRKDIEMEDVDALEEWVNDNMGEPGMRVFESTVNNFKDKLLNSCLYDLIKEIENKLPQLQESDKWRDFKQGFMKAAIAQDARGLKVSSPGVRTFESHKEAYGILNDPANISEPEMIAFSLLAINSDFYGDSLNALSGVKLLGEAFFKSSGYRNDGFTAIVKDAFYGKERRRYNEEVAYHKSYEGKYVADIARATIINIDFMMKKIERLEEIAESEEFKKHAKGTIYSEGKSYYDIFAGSIAEAKLVCGAHRALMEHYLKHFAEQITSDDKRTTTNEVAPASEREHAVKFDDATKYVQAKQGAQPMIVAVGKSWIKGYEQGNMQFDALNPLTSHLANYRGPGNVAFVIEEDKDLLAGIKKKMGEQGFEDPRIVALAGEDTVTKDLAEFATKKNVLVGVDNNELTEDSYIRIMEMLKILMQLAISPDIMPDSPNIPLVKRGNFWIFIPKPERMNYEQLRPIYAAQRSA